jgi:hypothetical protein
MPFPRQRCEPGKTQPQATLSTHFPFLHGRLVHGPNEVQLFESYPRLFWQAEKFRIVRSKIDAAIIAEREFQSRKDLKDSIFMTSFTEVDEFLWVATAVITRRKLTGLKFSEANWTVCFLHKAFLNRCINAQYPSMAIEFPR